MPGKRRNGRPDVLGGGARAVEWESLSPDVLQSVFTSLFADAGARGVFYFRGGFHFLGRK